MNLSITHKAPAQLSGAVFLCYTLHMNNQPLLFGDIIKNRPEQKKPPAHQWQEFALEVIEKLQIPGFKRNSVFKACKEFSRPVIEKAVNDTLELCKEGEQWKYFFKLLASQKAKQT